jgi:tetratricopeptide (TPR) repeat protein
MAKKPKKISRKKLLKEPDEFITFSGKLIRFGRTYRLQLALGFGALFAILIIVSGVRYFAIKGEQKAFALLNQAQAQYETLLKDMEPAEAYVKVKPEFEPLLDKFSNRQGGRLARIAFAHICYAGGAYQEAIVLYRDALNDFKDNPLMAHGLLSGLAYSHEALNEDAEAVRYFEMIVDGPDQILKDEALFHLGTLYQKTGDQTKSQKAFDTIVTDYPDSIYMELAKEKTAI